MQPVRNGVASDVPPPSPVPAALDAYLRGDFDACTATLDAATGLEPATYRETVLLRARIALRRQRYAEAIVLLRSELKSFVGVDEACTARMLHGIAVARSGRCKRGLTLLANLHAAARTMKPHPTIVAEIAYWLAFAHWLRRDFAMTLRYAYAAEAAHADIISVRAAALRGYVAAAKERYSEALALFRSAREKYRSCRERDADLRDRIEMQVATLEVALYSNGMTPTRLSAALCLPEEAPANAKSVFATQTATMDAWLHAFEGDKRRSYHRVRVSASLAPNEAWLVWALSNRAQIAAAFGDADVAYTFAFEALEIADGVAWNETSDEERVGLLLLAEVLASTDPPSAPEVLERYAGLTSKIDRALLFRDDVRLWILETFVRGLIHRVRRENQQAREAFRAVNAEARRVGVLWRAALALIELDATPVAAPDRDERFLQSATTLVRENFPRSFIARRLGWWTRAFDDQIAAKLSPRQREVLRHFLGAKTTKQMAKTMGLSEHTVKEYQAAVFRLFGVNSKDELLVACYQRGIGSPSWWDALDESNAPPIASERSPKASARPPARHSRPRSAR